MTDEIDEAGLLPPVSEEAPCGPDLDLEGDSEFMNFMAATEGQLPASYFSPGDGKPFDRKSIDFPSAFSTAEKLLARSHDLRLVVLLAKLSILNRDLEGFARWLATAARLLAEHWDDVHPRGEDGDFAVRLMQLSTLEDGPVVVLPLQYAPVAETQRDGPLPFRAQLVALGEIKLREGETLPNAGAIDKILLNADMGRLAKTLQILQLVKTSIGRIRTISLERVDVAEALSFGTLSPLVDKMIAFVQASLARRDPSFAAPEPVAEEADASGETGAAAAPSEFTSLSDVDAALGAALGYFETQEPSSAAVLLIGQARQLLGKNLYDVMKLLAPTQADNARIHVGAEPAFTVPVSSIAANGGGEPLERREAAPAASRAAALALIDSVAIHMRRVEPSSPAPYLLDRARTLASRDFLSLLKDLLSEDALSQMKGGAS
jgi:type VI secretion system protein ImpA